MKLNEKQITALEDKGFKRWTKGNMDRLYINAETLGLELDYYKSGNISGATYRGETISNRRGGEMKQAKTYIDIETGELHATNWTLEQDAQQLYDETMEALEAPETTEEEDETMKQIIINNTEWTEIEAIIDGEETPALLIHDLADVNRDGDMIVANGCELPTSEEDAETILANETGMTEFRSEGGKYYIGEDASETEAPVNREYEVKAKIVRAGASRVFQSWHDNAGISMEDFLDGLRWLCDDPMTDGHLTRELGCIRRAGSGYTPEQLAILGDVQDDGTAGLYRLTRSYYRDGSFEGFYDEDGRLWGRGSDRASINRMDRV